MKVREGIRSKDRLNNAEGGNSEIAYMDEYQQNSLRKQRDRNEKSGNYASNQELSMSSQSKTVQTQKRQWKATDADSKERKNSPFADQFDDKNVGYGASFQN